MANLLQKIALSVLTLGLSAPFASAQTATHNGTFKQVSSVDELTEGNYLIVVPETYTTTFSGMSNNLKNGHLTGTTLTPAGATVSNPNTIAVWHATVTEIGGQKYFHFKNEAEQKYLTVKPSSTNNNSITFEDELSQTDNKCNYAKITQATKYPKNPTTAHFDIDFSINSGDKGILLWNSSSKFFGTYNKHSKTLLSVRLFKEEGSTPAALTLTISTAKYATLFSDKALTLPAGLKAYVGKVKNKALELQEVTGGAIPANTAVVLAGEPATYTLSQATSSVAPVAAGSNDLQGSLQRKTPEEIAADHGYFYFALAQPAGNEVGFYKVASGIKAGKAYLRVNGTQFSTNKLNIRLGDSAPTGISAPTSVLQSAPVYDLNGRRVKTVRPGQIYLQKGKKFIAL